MPIRFYAERIFLSVVCGRHTKFKNEVVFSDFNVEII